MGLPLQVLANGDSDIFGDIKCSYNVSIESSSSSLLETFLVHILINRHWMKE